MQILLKDRVIFRVLSVLALLITLLTSVSLYLMYRNHLAVSEKLVTNQKRYIHQLLTEEEKHLSQLELNHIQEHALSIVDSIENALLYNLDKEVILEALKVFMKQKSIRDISIYDDITHTTYLTLQKRPDGYVRRINGEINTTGLRPMRFPLSIDGNILVMRRSTTIPTFF